MPRPSYLSPSIMPRTRPSKGWIAVLPQPQQDSAMALSFIMLTYCRKGFTLNNTLFKSKIICFNQSYKIFLLRGLLDPTLHPALREEIWKRPMKSHLKPLRR
jgi:hypothetical protein